MRTVLHIALIAGYLGLAAVIGQVIVAAVESAPMIREAEGVFGRALTCDEAYAYRAINAFFFPERTAQGDILYRFSLFSPVILGGFAAVLVVIVLYRRLTQLRWILIGIGVLLLAAVLIYMPVIRTVACAVE